MFKHTTIGFKDSGVLNRLVLDYLEQHETLKPFSGFYPNKKGFKQLLDQQPYATFDHAQLAGVLLKQSESVKNTSEFSLKNISLLKNKNTFTVTTGHQLCLFTGPLYFIYKIISTINLAEKLKLEFPQCAFVPVYWMASEDHDFEEVNHLNSSGKTITWESKQTGAVGDFKTDELKKILPSIIELLGKSENSNYLISLFENSYLKNTSLADATRFLVNELFGQYGLVTLDGNDKQFKTQFIDHFKRDIFEGSAFTLVNESIKQLEALGYRSQVNPRNINCFYVENGLRARIEKVGENYTLVGTDKSFTKKELEKIIEEHPEKISPNVVLRPLYQQVILPNLAYVGGPGELAYWLEFKKMFDEFKVLFPILMPRNFVAIIDKPTKNKIDKLHFSGADVFKSETDLIKKYLVQSDAIFKLGSEKEKISTLYSTITDKVTKIDSTLTKSALAELQKTINGLERIITKVNRALKRKSETEINQIHSVKQTLFPTSIPQERHENFSYFYLKYGGAFFNELKKNLDPFLLEQNIFTEI